MRLYYFPLAPNPTKVLVYVREKGIEDQLELCKVDITQGEQNSPEHLARNPAGVLPVLELEPGAFLTESLTIMEYLEECFPAPAMIGTTPLARARTREFERKVEQQVLTPIARTVHATNSPLGLPPNPVIAEAEAEKLEKGLQRVDAWVGDKEFATGDTPSIVDCSLFAGLQFGQFFGMELEPRFANLCRWYAAFSQRPSAQMEL